MDITLRRGIKDHALASTLLEVTAREITLLLVMSQASVTNKFGKQEYETGSLLPKRTGKYSHKRKMTPVG